MLKDPKSAESLTISLESLPAALACIPIGTRRSWTEDRYCLDSRVLMAYESTRVFDHFSASGTWPAKTTLNLLATSSRSDAAFTESFTTSLSLRKAKYRAPIPTTAPATFMIRACAVSIRLFMVWTALPVRSNESLPRFPTLSTSDPNCRTFSVPLSSTISSIFRGVVILDSLPVVGYFPNHQPFPRRWPRSRPGQRHTPSQNSLSGF